MVTTKIYHVRQLLFAITLSCIMMVAGCSSKSNPKDLVGKWREIGRNRTIEFRADGKQFRRITLPSGEEAVTSKGTYKIVDGSHAVLVSQLQFSKAEPSEVPIEYSMSGNRLMIVYPSNSAEYEKVK